MKISIITITYNSSKTIASTLESVLHQNYHNIEHIVVDGLSSDNTMEIVKQFPHVKKYISEKDNGLYDALNKGINIATGDIIGILHSDDFLASNDAISNVAKVFESNDIDALCTDVGIYRNNNFDKPYRRYRAKHFKNWQFRLGMQPPHPGIFIKRSCYTKYGLYNTSYKISGDFELLLRFFFIHKIKFINKNFLSVKMRDGGTSNQGLKSKILMNKEDLRALKSNNVYSNLPFIWSKYFFKIRQFFT